MEIFLMFVEVAECCCDLWNELKEKKVDHMWSRKLIIYGERAARSSRLRNLLVPATGRPSTVKPNVNQNLSTP